MLYKFCNYTTSCTSSCSFPLYPLFLIALKPYINPFLLAGKRGGFMLDKLACVLLGFDFLHTIDRRVRLCEAQKPDRA